MRHCDMSLLRESRALRAKKGADAYQSVCHLEEEIGPVEHAQSAESLAGRGAEHRTCGRTQIQWPDQQDHSGSKALIQLGPLV